MLTEDRWTFIRFTTYGAIGVAETIILFFSYDRLGGITRWLMATPLFLLIGLIVYAAASLRARELVGYAAGYLGGWLLAGAAVVSFIVWVLVTFPTPEEYVGCEKDIPFSSGLWKNERLAQETYVRSCMVRDLQRRFTFVGMPRWQVDDLLGVPPSTTYFPEYDYVYYIEPYGLDSKWLVLKFSGDVVVKAAYVSD